MGLCHAVKIHRNLFHINLLFGFQITNISFVSLMFLSTCFRLTRYTKSSHILEWNSIELDLLQLCKVCH